MQLTVLRVLRVCRTTLLAKCCNTKGTTRRYVRMLLIIEPGYKVAGARVRFPFLCWYCLYSSTFNRIEEILVDVEWKRGSIPEPSSAGRAAAVCRRRRSVAERGLRHDGAYVMGTDKILRSEIRDTTGASTAVRRCYLLCCMYDTRYLVRTILHVPARTHSTYQVVVL